MASSQRFQARVLEIELTTATRPGELERARVEPWRSADPLLRRVGSWSGAALGLSWLRDHPRHDGAFVLAVGDAVRRGVPTAVRTTVLARSPLTGRLAQGQVGSDLALRLVPCADAVVLHGRTKVPGAVLVLRAGGVELLSLPELVGEAPDERARRLVEHLGPCAVLRTGPAAAAGVPFANLASGLEPTSFVGRGGLGAALARLGIEAIVVTAPPVAAASSQRARRISEALASSPRLQERAAAGTFELSHAFAARGDLRAHGYRTALSVDEGRALTDAALRAGKERHGCKGCPTPCGWVFERPGGARGGARFSATYALGTNLGLTGFEDALALLALCNELGVDAKEAGALLASRAREAEAGGRRMWGDRPAFERVLRSLLDGHAGIRPVPGAVEDAASFVVGGEAARPQSDKAALLGQCVGSRGAEPMRTFPFLVGGDVPRARVERLVHPMPLPPGAEDPLDPRGKGRLVYWHENLVTALDAIGFCAFSAAGLLADGACDLDTLASWIAPEGLASLGGGPLTGEHLLAAGATLVVLQRLVEIEWGVPPPEVPSWARAGIEDPGMAPEYRRLRGFDDPGGVTPTCRAALGTLGLLAPAARLAGGAIAAGVAPVPAASGPRAPGSVELRGVGPLARQLGATAAIALQLPAPLLEVLETAARALPGARDWLVREGQPVPAVYRDGERVAPHSLVQAGDRLDLVLALPGG